MSLPALALPGDRLTSTSSHTAGPGTFNHASSLYSSQAGSVKISKTSLSVTGEPSRTPLQDFSALIPSVNDIILGRVTRTNPRQATLDILALIPSLSGDPSSKPDPNAPSSAPRPLREPFQALIRQQDMRATEIDKVLVSESFRVGDIVRAMVISVGDERNYYVSTARNEFGVVFARAGDGSGEVLVPVSWREMRGMKSGIVEKRKVAKTV